MSVREENELSNDCTGGIQISAVTGGIRSSVEDGIAAISPPTGDPNPKKFFAKPGDNNPIDNNLTVPLDKETVTFTADELFDPKSATPLRGLAFTLQCDKPELASIVVPDHDMRTWRNQNGTVLKPGEAASSIMLNDPAQQRLDGAVNRISLDVKLKLHRKGSMTVTFNVDVTNTPGVTKGDPQSLTVEIV